MSFDCAPLKTFDKYKFSDFQQDDEIQVEEQTRTTPSLRHSYRGLIKSISNNQIDMEVSCHFDADLGGEITAPNLSGQILRVQAKNIKIARRGMMQL
jgi:hypothetical protein